MREYDPLSIQELGKNAVQALMACDIEELPPANEFDGAGIYALHYSGDFAPYAEMSETPIYVGKADNGLHKRLNDHASTIEQTANLVLGDFGCRGLILEQVWINLTEQILIKRYSPVWNHVLTGFGNHDPGSGRHNQMRSHWDTVHPGRFWAERLRVNSTSYEFLIKRIDKHRSEYER